MKRLTIYAVGWMLGAAGATMVLGGEASTWASARNGGGGNAGSAAAWANYEGDDGRAVTRTRTRTGTVTIARGLTIGFDRDGLDVSFSHAIAGKVGPAYAGTFNLSIGYDGSVAGSYGGAVSQGGWARSAEAGGSTRSDRWGTNALASASGNTVGWGTVNARTDSFSRQARPPTPVRWGADARRWR